MASRFLRTRPPTWNKLLRVMLQTALCMLGAVPLLAQGRDTIPTTPYFLTFADYFEGRYGDALKGFNSEGRGGVKGISGRWIDSICYHTMAGECHYQMGRYPEALDEYTAALQLYLKHNDWMIRVTSAGIKPAGLGRVKTCPWGRSTRNSRIGDVPDTMTVAQGQVDNNAAVENRGRGAACDADRAARQRDRPLHGAVPAAAARAARSGRPVRYAQCGARGGIGPSPYYAQ